MKLCENKRELSINVYHVVKTTNVFADRFANLGASKELVTRLSPQESPAFHKRINGVISVEKAALPGVLTEQHNTHNKGHHNSLLRGSNLVSRDRSISLEASAHNRITAKPIKAIKDKAI